MQFLNGNLDPREASRNKSRKRREIESAREGLAHAVSDVIWTPRERGERTHDNIRNFSQIDLLPDRGGTVDNSGKKTDLLVYERKEHFGIRGYSIPRGEIQRLPIKNCASLAGKPAKKMSIFTEYSQMTKYVPGPGKYIKVDKWTADPSSNFQVKMKGCFLKSKKMTYLDIISQEEKHKSGPNKYDTRKW